METEVNTLLGSSVCVCVWVYGAAYLFPFLIAFSQQGAPFCIVHTAPVATAGLVVVDVVVVVVIIVVVGVYSLFFSCFCLSV